MFYQEAMATGRRGVCGGGHYFFQHGEGRGWGERGFEGRAFAMRGPGHGGFGGGWRGFGRGRERLFDAGDVKLVILKLLEEQPSYGYQLIKTMEERMAGGYTPSAGIIYPTLTMLEEEGLATAVSESGRKVYSVTAEGTAYLEGHKERLEELFARLEETGRGFRRGRSPELMEAFAELRSAVMARMWRRNVSDEQLQKITEAIRQAAKTIDEL